MKTKVDENLCTGCGLCVDICPEVFEMGETVSVVKVDVVPPELEDKVREAAENCPVDAISVEK
ncbi:MAG: ferredoxin [Candidatus Omnitrophica bacterium]|nr:ferredoxin [Candidatus Omnitrophota bacterium]